MNSVDDEIDNSTSAIVTALAFGRLLQLVYASEHPSLVMSCSFTNQVLTQLDLAGIMRATDVMFRGMHDM